LAKVPEAEARMFHRMFVCRDCKTKNKLPVLKVSEGVAKCRKCKSNAMRPVRKK
jgi:ribosomal protein L40E